MLEPIEDAHADDRVEALIGKARLLPLYKAKLRVTTFAEPALALLDHLSRVIDTPVSASSRKEIFDENTWPASHVENDSSWFVEQVEDASPPKVKANSNRRTLEVQRGVPIRDVVEVKNVTLDRQTLIVQQFDATCCEK